MSSCSNCKAKNVGKWKFCSSCGQKKEKKITSTAAYHFVIMGSGGVGKSSITIRFMNQRFEERYDPTIEDRYSKIVECEGVHCSLEVLDTAGQETFSAMRELYMKNGQGFVLVFSLNHSRSLDDLREFYLGIRKYKGSAKFPLVLVGNKKDLKRELSSSSGKDIAAKWECPYIECSAKKDENISDIFFTLIKESWKILGVPASKKKENCNLL
eukprot:TRINITY_DN1241_c0_g1_i1.p1 TRINITY_DN1241_c0_g1~~TRINITY_DN1241_c0_g1_i1.p1  ORF type:complete len:212 (-),score=27.68 TRINITY_DN1241_c0_g1_i1:53-688(-)